MNCPNCNAKYDVVRTEATAPATDAEVKCLDCDAPFPAREGAFIMKYFLVERPRLRLRRAR